MYELKLNCLAEKPDDQYKRAKEEWDVISPLPIIFADREEAGPYSERPSELLTLDEVTSYLEHVDISEELRQIKPVAQPTGFLAFLRKILFLGPPTLLNQSERDRIFAIAMKPFDNQEPMHARFLTTIYQKLTAQALFKCPRYGRSHTCSAVRVPVLKATSLHHYTIEQETTGRRLASKARIPPQTCVESVSLAFTRFYFSSWMRIRRSSLSASIDSRSIASSSFRSV